MQDTQLMTRLTRCPCGSTKPYADCCQPFHQQAAVAATAKQLMRSRYSAFFYHLTNYLLTTHHPDFHVPNEALTLKKTLNESTWIALDIISHHAGTSNDLQGAVEFKARCLEGKVVSELHAGSNFIKESGQWYYTDDQFRYFNVIKIGRNDLCSCGSGKKFKKCHG